MLAKALRYEVKFLSPFDATKMATCLCSSCFTHVNMKIMVIMSQLRSIVTPHNFVLPTNSNSTISKNMFKQIYISVCIS